MDRETYLFGLFDELLGSIKLCKGEMTERKYSEAV